MTDTSIERRFHLHVATRCCLLAAVAVLCCRATAGTVSVSYTDLPLGTSTDLSAVSAGDWVKWGNNDNGTTFSTVRQQGVTPIISSTLFPLGTPPPGTNVVLTSFSGNDVLSFDWTDGDSPASGSSDTVITETILPPQPDYPLGLGVFMNAAADASTRVLDVWVQGFNADMLLLATMSGGGSDQVVVSPSKIIDGNNFASGVLRVNYSGAGETLTVSIVTLPPLQPGVENFPNAGIFAAAIVPEPAGVVLMGAAAVGLALVVARRRPRAGARAARPPRA